MGELPVIVFDSATRPVAESLINSRTNYGLIAKVVKQRTATPSSLVQVKVSPLIKMSTAILFSRVALKVEHRP